MTNAGKLAGVVIILGMVIGGVLLATRAGASETTSPEFTEEGLWVLEHDIMAAPDFVTLNALYNQIDEMRKAGLVTVDEYNTLYMAYVRRFYQLIGVA